MSTRGAFGFIKNKEYKVHYNHFDSYLEGKGQDVVEFVKNTPIENMNKIFDNIVLVNQTDLPNESQIKEVNKILKENGLENKYEQEHFGSTKLDWYYLLNPTQGNLELYNKGLKYMTNDKEFLNDSLFCEFAYLIDLDQNKLLIRSNERESSYDFDKIPNDWIKDSYSKFENKCREKFINLLYDKDEDKQKEILKDLGVSEKVKTPLIKYDYYAQDSAYKEILKNYDEKEFESILDNYLENDMEYV